jgi:RimJ/RimL family protein N-acetyltransferase
MTNTNKNKIKINVKLKKPNELTIIIETDRLKICSVKPEYYDIYYKLFSDEKVMKNYEYGVPFIDHSIIKNRIDHWNEKWQQNNPYSGYAVFDKNTNLLIGHIDLETSDETEQGSIELGYIYFSEYWKKGYGTEAASAIIKILVPCLSIQKYTINNHPVEKIIATTHKDNLASQKILETVGFNFDNLEIIRYGTKRLKYSLNVRNLVEHTLSDIKMGLLKFEHPKHYVFPLINEFSYLLNY